MVFESLVNTEGIQTSPLAQTEWMVFESLVNTEGIQTRVGAYTTTPPV